MQVFVACGIGSGSGKRKSEEDPFRKPKPGMWHIMENHFNDGKPIDLDQLSLSLSLSLFVLLLSKLQALSLNFDEDHAR